MNYYLVNTVTKEILQQYGTMPSQIAIPELKLRQNSPPLGRITYYAHDDTQPVPVIETPRLGKDGKPLLDAEGNELPPLTRTVPGKPNPGILVETHYALVPEEVVDPKTPGQVATGKQQVVTDTKVITTITYRDKTDDERLNELRRAARQAEEESMLMKGTTPEAIAYQQELQRRT